jgi:hypothetical protein
VRRFDLYDVGIGALGHEHLDVRRNDLIERLRRIVCLLACARALTLTNNRGTMKMTTMIIGSIERRYFGAFDSVCFMVDLLITKNWLIVKPVQASPLGEGLGFENCRSGIAIVHGFLLLLTDCSACCLAVGRWIGEMEHCWSFRSLSSCCAYTSGIAGSCQWVEQGICAVLAWVS